MLMSHVLRSPYGSAVCGCDFYKSYGLAGLLGNNTICSFFIFLFFFFYIKPLLILDFIINVNECTMEWLEDKCLGAEEITLFAE